MACAALAVVGVLAVVAGDQLGEFGARVDGVVTHGWTRSASWGGGVGDLPVFDLVAG